MAEFPVNLQNVLSIAANKHKLLLAKETHYDAINRELIYYNKNIRKRLDFTLVDNVIKVTSYKDKFPFSPKVFEFIHNYIPLCPLFAKIEWHPLGDLSISESESFYVGRINSFVEDIITDNAL